MLAPFMKSWKTTTVAFLLAADAIGHAVMALLDTDPATVPDWNAVIVMVMAAVGLLFAKDADRGVTP